MLKKSYAVLIEVPSLKILGLHKWHTQNHSRLHFKRWLQFNSRT